MIKQLEKRNIARSANYSTHLLVYARGNASSENFSSRERAAQSVLVLQKLSPRLFASAINNLIKSRWTKLRQRVIAAA